MSKEIESGCKHHDNCFTCPFRDCILGQLPPGRPKKMTAKDLVIDMDVKLDRIEGIINGMMFKHNNRVDSGLIEVLMIINEYNEHRKTYKG